MNFEQKAVTLDSEFVICEQRVSGLIESFNFLAEQLRRQGQNEAAHLVRDRALPKAQGLLGMLEALKQETRRAPPNPGNSP
jgi:hypothetical protein